MAGVFVGGLGFVGASKQGETTTFHVHIARAAAATDDGDAQLIDRFACCANSLGKLPRARFAIATCAAGEASKLAVILRVPEMAVAWVAAPTDGNRTPDIRWHDAVLLTPALAAVLSFQSGQVYVAQATLPLRTNNMALSRGSPLSPVPLTQLLPKALDGVLSIAAFVHSNTVSAKQALAFVAKGSFGFAVVKSPTASNDAAQTPLTRAPADAQLFTCKSSLLLQCTAATIACAPFVTAISVGSSHILLVRFNPLLEDASASTLSVSQTIPLSPASGGMTIHRIVLGVHGTLVAARGDRLDCWTIVPPKDNSDATADELTVIPLPQLVLPCSSCTVVGVGASTTAGKNSKGLLGGNTELLLYDRERGSCAQLSLENGVPTPSDVAGACWGVAVQAALEDYPVYAYPVPVASMSDGEAGNATAATLHLLLETQNSFRNHIRAVTYWSKLPSVKQALGDLLLRGSVAHKTLTWRFAPGALRSALRCLSHSDALRIFSQCVAVAAVRGKSSVGAVECALHIVTLFRQIGDGGELPQDSVHALFGLLRAARAAGGCLSEEVGLLQMNTAAILARGAPHQHPATVDRAWSASTRANMRFAFHEWDRALGAWSSDAEACHQSARALLDSVAPLHPGGNDCIRFGCATHSDGVAQRYESAMLPGQD